MKATWLMLMYVAVILIEASNYHQSDYGIKLEIVDIPSYNHSYLRNVTCGLVYHNRTYRAINCSIYLRKDLSTNLKVEFQAYKFLSNEYRFFPVTMTVHVCKEFEKDTFGLRESLQKSLNFEPRCPLKRGWLRMTYGRIDFSRFPPYIPSGRYKADVKFYDGSNFVATVHVFCKVEEAKWAWKP